MRGFRPPQVKGCRAYADSTKRTLCGKPVHRGGLCVKCHEQFERFKRMKAAQNAKNPNRALKNRMQRELGLSARQIKKLARKQKQADKEELRGSGQALIFIEEAGEIVQLPDGEPDGK